MNSRTVPRKIGRVIAVALGTAVLATLAASPAQAEVNTWVLLGPVREPRDFDNDLDAIKAAQDDLPALEQQCRRQDGVVEQSTVRATEYHRFWARVDCRSKRGI